MKRWGLMASILLGATLAGSTAVHAAPPSGLPAVPGLPGTPAGLPALPGVPALPGGSGVPALPALTVPTLPDQLVVLRPETTLDSVPPEVTESARSVVTFHDSGPATGTQCSLDGAAYAACTSPLAIVTPAGPHRLLVRADGAAGPDPTPAVVNWRVAVSKLPGYGLFMDTLAPAVTTLTANAEDQSQHVTLMNVAGRVAAPVLGHPWYLWVWTHDTPYMKLYTAAKSTGPFVQSATFKPAVPPPGWCVCHWSSGDVVWDPETKYFYSTPHSIEAPSAAQADENSVKVYGHQLSFIIRSKDGLNWERVSDTPIVPNGAPGAFDDYEIAYGRLLRDIDGNLVRRNGSAVWYYRGDNRPLTCDPGTQRCADLDNPESHQRYGLGAAVSVPTDADPSGLSTWKKVSDTPILTLSGESSIFDIGSAIQSGDRTTLTTSISNTMFQRSSDDPLAWPQSPVTVNRANDVPALGSTPQQTADPGTPIYLHPSVLSDGGNIVRDGNDLRMAFGSFAGTHFEVHIASAAGGRGLRAYGS